MGTGGLPIHAWSSRVRARARACCKVECHLGLYYQNHHLRPQRNNDSQFSQLSAWLHLASTLHIVLVIFSKLIQMLTKCQVKARLVIQTGVVLSDLFEAISERILVKSI